MIPNHLTPPDLLGHTSNDIAALPAAELARLQHDSEEALRKAKAVIAWLESALLLKYGERARVARLEAEKHFGTTRFHDGEVEVVTDVPKRIDWDQRELGQLVERLKAEGEDPRDYIEISFKVAERKYASWPSHIRKVFEPARTVRAGTQSFRLTLEKEAV